MICPTTRFAPGTLDRPLDHTIRSRLSGGHLQGDHDDYRD
jgi:hypothetical protein